MKKKFCSVSQTGDKFLKIEFTEPAKRVSCEIRYCCDGENFLPASLYRSVKLDEEESGSQFLWSEAQARGIARLDGRITAVYWNPYLNISDYTGAVKLQIICVNNDASVEEITVDMVLDDCGVVYLSHWQSRSINSDGRLTDEWRAFDGDVEAYNKTEFVLESVLRIELPAKGEYDIFLGFAGRVGRYMLKLDREEHFQRFITAGHTMLQYPDGYHSKPNKEIFWKRCQLNGNFLEISPLKETTCSFHHFGSVPYVKLVPAGKSCRTELAESLPDREVILYYEPYSYTLHGFHDTATMNSVMLSEFMAVKPTEISCQVCRIGMKTLHDSEIIAKLDTPANTDENVVVDDPPKLAQAGDILAESVKYMQSSPIKLSVNIGMNRPYLWLKEISDRFTLENPQLIKGGCFDYTLPEVMAYAKSIIGELIDNYDVQGVIFDYMRSYHNQTVETLVETAKFAKEKLMAKGGNRELKMRIPADDPTYFRAMEISVAKRYVDGIIPSNLVSTRPLPPVKHYLSLCKDSETKVYGCIDGWLACTDGDSRAGNLGYAVRRRDFVEAWHHYCAAGVDGIFIYQADNYTANPYVKPLLESRALDL